MSPSKHAGPVSGLAAALGLTAFLVAGQGTAWADADSDSSSAAGSTATSAASPDSAATSGPAESSPSAQSDASASEVAATGVAAGSVADVASRSGSEPNVSSGRHETARVRDSARVRSRTSARADSVGDERDLARAVSAAALPTSAVASESPPPPVAVITRPADDAESTAHPNTTPPPTGISAAADEQEPPAGAASQVPDAEALMSAVTDVVDPLASGLDPLAGDAPATPADSLAAWALLAFSRRELSAETVTPAAAAANPLSNATSVGPTVAELTDGIINGNIEPIGSQGTPLVYTLLTNGSNGGKVSLDKDTGTFAFLPDYSTVATGGTEQFSVLVSEKTWLVDALTGLPLIGSVFMNGLVTLYQVPILNVVLAPIIGHAVARPVSVNVGALAPAGTPVAFTVKVASFDGTLISTNFFPAAGLQESDTAPVVFVGAGLRFSGNINPFSVRDPATENPVLGIAPLRAAGYNVVTWDSRGKGDSGGLLQLDNPFFEGRDVSAIIDFLADQPGVRLEADNDPMMGMIGGSYGGGVQLVSAAIDHRIDAIVPAITWNSLNQSLYRDDAFKTLWADALLALLVSVGADINPQIYPAILAGNVFGTLSESDQALLASSGPTALVNNITAPTLLIQGTADGLFPLNQAVENATMLAANEVPVKMIWFCGGHGRCLDPVDVDQQDQLILDSTLAWLDQYVMGDPGMPADDLPTFQWVDQNGDYYASDFMPFDPEFDGDPIVAASSGGLLPIVPIIGGSGPQNLAPLPFSLLAAAPASNSLNLTVQAPSETETTYIVGTPELTLTYAGLGIAGAVYAQVVDNETGRVLGNLVTPIPLTLDGQTHTVTVPLEAVAYTMDPGDALTVQLTGSALSYLNLDWGVLSVSGMQLSLPTVDAGVAAPV